jgi:hypothetical protein
MEVWEGFDNTPYPTIPRGVLIFFGVLLDFGGKNEGIFFYMWANLDMW